MFSGLGFLASGALAGAGQAMQQIGAEDQKTWGQKELLQERNRMDMEKEKRIEEAQIAAEGRQEGYQQAAEQRQIANNGTMARQTNDINLEYAPKLTQSKIDEQNAMLPGKLKEAQGLSDINSNASIKVHNATDNTDYAGRAIDLKLKQAALDQTLDENKGMSKSDRNQAESFKSMANAYQKTIDSPETPSTEKASAIEDLHGVLNAWKSIYQKNGIKFNQDNSNPLGITEGNTDNKTKPEGSGFLSGISSSKPSVNTRIIGTPTKEQQEMINSGKWKIQKTQGRGSVIQELVPTAFNRGSMKVE